MGAPCIRRADPQVIDATGVRMRRVRSGYSAVMPTAQPHHSPSTSWSEPPRTRARTVGGVILWIETVMLAVVALLNLWLVSIGGVPARFGIGLSGFLLVLAVGVGIAARSLRRGGRFGVGFGITWQLFQALIAVSLLRAGIYPHGTVVLVLSVVGFVVLINVARSGYERELRARS